MAAWNPRANEIFLGALDIDDPRERQSYVDAACDDDSELRRQVESLLAAHAEAGGFLNNPADARDATGPYSPSSSAEADRPQSEFVGTTVGPYRIIELLGEGGMGAVYLAEQQEPIKRRVALKIIKAGMDSAQVIARFEAERQALALMDHPNIAKVFDAGATTGGRPYFVMELVNGIAVTKYCDREHLTLKERLELFIPVCQAVQHAHQKGVIHRDLKPSNVLVASYDGNRVPKVIDFGVAKATQQQLTDRTMFTEAGVIVGTLEYMAPEQAELNNIDIDTRADVYSLGVLLYELLAGSPPFASRELRGAAFMEMLRIIREVEPPKPSTKLSSSEQLPNIAANRKLEPKRLTSMMHGDLDWIAMKCLEKDRRRRYETANQLALEVQRYLANEPVLAGPPSAGYRLRKFVRRNRPQVIAGILVLLTLLTGIAGTSWQAVRADEARKQETARAEGERQAKESAEKRLSQIEKANEILGSIFRYLNPREAKLGGKSLQVLLGERLDHATSQIEEEAIGDPLAVARIQQTLGESQLNLGYPEKAISLLTKASATLTVQFGADHSEALVSKGNLARAYLDAGKLDLSLALFDETLTPMKARLGPDHQNTLTIMYHLGEANRAAGRRDAAILTWEQTLNLSRPKLGSNHPLTLGIMNSLANGYREAGRLDAALPLLDESYKQLEANLGSDHPDLLAGLNNLALGYQESGNLNAALPLLEKAVKLMKAKLGADHPETLQGINNLAACYRAAGNIDAALPHFEETLRQMRAKLGPDHPSVFTVMNNLAVVYGETGKWDAAISLLAETLKLTTAKLGPDHPDTLRNTGNLAMAYKGAGKYDLALPLLEETLKRKKDKFGLDHPSTLTSMNNLASSYQSAGKLDAAIPLFEDTLTRMKGKLGPDHPTTLTVTSNLGAYLDAGRSDEALSQFALFLAGWRKQLEADTPRFARMLAQVSMDLLKTRQFVAAEPYLRESLGISETEEPNAWTTYNTKSLLGGSLLGQKRYSDAEPLLLAGYEGLKQRAAKLTSKDKPRLPEAIERLVQLYEETGKPDDAAKWRNELESAKPSVKP